MSNREIRNALYVARRKRDVGGGLTADPERPAKASTPVMAEPARLCNIKSTWRL